MKAKREKRSYRKGEIEELEIRRREGEAKGGKER